MADVTPDTPGQAACEDGTPWPWGFPNVAGVISAHDTHAPSPLARVLAEAARYKAERDEARQAEEATSADRERYLIALRNVARILASCVDKLTPIETVELIDDEVSSLDLSEEERP